MKVFVVYDCINEEVKAVFSTYALAEVYIESVSDFDDFFIYEFEVDEGI